MPNYLPILDSEIDAESPITESLMTRLRDNPLSFIGESYTELTGSGTYTVPSNVNLLKVILIGGGSGGKGGGTTDGGGGGTSGCVYTAYVSTSGGASISYACGSGGAGGINTGDGSDGGNTTFGSETAKGGKGAAHLNGPPAIDQTRTFHLQGGEGSTFTTTDGTDGGVYPSVIHGVAGTKATAGTAGGGGGAPCGLPFSIQTSSLGNGGDGSDTETPTSASNATSYGAGGGGGQGTNSNLSDGGNGSAGIIFILPLNA